jgi:hypothetical protein
MDKPPGKRRALMFIHLPIPWFQAVWIGSQSIITPMKVWRTTTQPSTQNLTPKPQTPTGTVEGAKKIAQSGVYPLMSPDQLFLFVPPAYGAGSDDLSEQLCCASHTRDGSNPDCFGDCSSAMINWALEVYDWARNDSKIVGLNPWHMNGAPQVNASFEPGMNYLPAVLETWKKIGAEIVSGLLRDI